MAQERFRLAVQRVVNDMATEYLLIGDDNPNQKHSKPIPMTAKGELTLDLALELQDPWVKALYAGISRKRLIEAKAALIAIGAKLENQA